MILIINIENDFYQIESKSYENQKFVTILINLDLNLLLIFIKLKKIKKNEKNEKYAKNQKKEFINFSIRISQKNLINFIKTLININFNLIYNKIKNFLIFRNINFLN